MRLRHVLALVLGFTGCLPALAEDWAAITVAGRSVEPGTKRKFAYLEAASFEAQYLDAPVFVARGARRGYTLCVTAGIHGDELNGVEIAREVFARTDPTRLEGTLLVFPTVNADGIRNGQRYMTDRRDLNRAFPGNPNGSVAAVVAHALFTEVIAHCHALIDLHTGSFQRSNRPQIRVGADDPRSFNIARHFGVGIIVFGDGPEGSLRRRAAERGIPSIIYEAGSPHRFEAAEIAAGVRGVESVMAYLEMIDADRLTVADSQVFARTSWLRVPRGGGGYFFPACDLGQRVAEGKVLGRVVDPLTDEEVTIRAPYAAEVIGMATPQIVLSGYALFHIGTAGMPSSPATSR
jgi:predicted deacylase